MTLRTRLGPTVGLGRRTVVGVGLGLGASALAGCALNNPLEQDRTPAARAVRNLAPDVAVAVEAATAIRRAAAAVTATSKRHPALAAKLSGLGPVHAAHLAAVADAVPDGVDTTSSANGTPYAVPARPARALVQLTAAEQSLHDTLLGLAMRAESGPFARLLGAMAAAISQQLHGLAG
jgi:hypothetical protein